MFKIKSFQRRILTALMGIGLVPATLLLLLGIWTLQFFIGLTGSAGPWGSLAARPRTRLWPLRRRSIGKLSREA